MIGLEGEIEGNVVVEYVHEKGNVVKVWCKNEGVKEEIWSKKREWERKGLIRVEEWLMIRERRTRHEAMSEMRSVVRNAGFKGKL